ncbi:MAG: cob(I)yrinic acid a,c-diamide adenosyltransferase [Deltaproteobacteria bacterium]|nr:cob(I)yrinic acid a,c-diamide adenosyltransferase [Deltaproteobacteria bacterium]
MNGPQRILIYTGDGKGKTSAALGTALRACGNGIKVLILQFIKADDRTGELAAVRHLTGIDMIQGGLGFVPPQSNPKFAEHRDAAQATLRKAREVLKSDKYDMIILDEACVAVSLGLIQEDDLVAAIAEARPELYLIMTGRNATPRLISLADTVTEMLPIKHAMSQGRKAQKGIEY